MAFARSFTRSLSHLSASIRSGAALLGMVVVAVVLINAAFAHWGSR